MAKDKDNQKKYYIKSELSENQIESDVSHYLGWIVGDGCTPFRLITSDESVTGADKEFPYDLGSLIYIQFKVSHGLKPISEIKVSNRKNMSELENIREYRNENELEDNPSLHFQLRAKAKTAKDFQHNVLMSYNRPPISEAIYVAPLILKKKEYGEILFQSSEKHRWLYPFYYRGDDYSWTNYPRWIPFLREHMSIVPHECVNTHEHYFSFSNTGVDLAWHSPTVLNREPSRLSDFFAEKLSKLSFSEKNWLLLEELEKEVNQITKQNLDSTDIEFSGKTALDRLQEHGKWLHTKYRIRQFLFLTNREFWLRSINRHNRFL